MRKGEHHVCIQGRGSFIGGDFHKAGGQELQSTNPANNYEPVFTTVTGDDQVDAAVAAARGALKDWMGLSQEQRNTHLRALKEQFNAHADEMAERMVLEMGKPLNEARGEAASLGARIDLMIANGLKRVATESPNGVAGEARYRAQGVLAVLGPYNFPAHLVNAHVIPALLTGNTVVVKPSELTPGVGELYATCIEKAGLPAGVYNMVQGTGAVGQQLTTHAGVDGVLFTGSYRTGRAIAQTMLDHPGKMLALEMGGKNMSVVMDDADLYQALVELFKVHFYLPDSDALLHHACWCMKKLHSLS